MRKVDILVLVIGTIAAISWIIVSNRDGFKANNATITARSISIMSTIDGQVINNPPKVGDRVRSNEVLVSIRNGRFDRGRLAEFDSQIAFYQAEIANLESQQSALKVTVGEYRQKAASFAKWTRQDTEIRNQQTLAELDIARYQLELAARELVRATKLSSSNLLTDASLQAAQAAANIAENQVAITEAQLRRNLVYLQGIARDGVFFENGDASYWVKMSDTLEIRLFDNVAKIGTLRQQLIQVRAQARVERQRIERSNAEEHLAPFNGMVNATFVQRGSRVTSGTSLYQILDCTQPVIIFPIPDNRVSEFSVGLRVTVYPTDTEQELPGRISYVTSGALIGADTSLQIQAGLTLGGNRAIVALDDSTSLVTSSESCETERRATVVIHTQSWYDEIVAWTSMQLPQLAMALGL